ncbi:Presenilins-associated rhomboid-like protein, mitochondrial [Tupaia chinensis]|uniref:Presenilin-associated rhomboid-like protein, mitochondrial n=1 Tax=Tupaia chinensis TaxID=246437 RepID=L9KWV1_TUPCH|nr:Presenilins-associated rhomboid-like protein, mitochondrial [Tupaia chinensis]
MALERPCCCARAPESAGWTAGAPRPTPPVLWTVGTHTPRPTPPVLWAVGTHAPRPTPPVLWAVGTHTPRPTPPVLWTLEVLCAPMLLSTFSHFSLFHMAANMYVLWSFSSSIVSILGQEQFMAVYLSAGVISNFVSYVCKVATGRYGPSLGASGAIMTVLAAVCTKIPEGRLAIIFLPMFTFTAGNALKAIIAMDTAGMILGWKFFDHAAHLGGALFGMLFCPPLPCLCPELSRCTELQSHFCLQRASWRTWRDQGCDRGHWLVWAPACASVHAGSLLITRVTLLPSFY